MIRKRVTDIGWTGEWPQIHTDESGPQKYDLIVGAVGVNSPALGLFEKLEKATNGQT